MSDLSSGRPRGRIWLIDQRDYWRYFLRQSLESAGFSVRAWSRYELPPEDPTASAELPDLVLLACTVPDVAEQGLVQQAVEHRHRVLVLAGSVPKKSMRLLFLAGAYDVADLPTSAEQLVDLVERTLGGPPGSALPSLLRARAQ